VVSHAKALGLRNQQKRSGDKRSFGRREHIPIPLTIGGSEWAGLINGISHGSRASAEVLVERLRETEASVAIAANEARSKMRGNGAGDVRRQLDAFADRA